MSIYQMNKQDTIDVARLETDLSLADFELQKLREELGTTSFTLNTLRNQEQTEENHNKILSEEDDLFLKNIEIMYAELDINQIQLDIQSIENQYNYNIPT